MYISLGVELRALPRAFAKRRRRVRELRGDSRNLRGVCRTLRGIRIEPARRNLFGGSVNPLGLGYLRLTFCEFDKLRLSPEGVLTERCIHTYNSPILPPQALDTKPLNLNPKRKPAPHHCGNVRGAGRGAGQGYII